MTFYNICQKEKNMFKKTLEAFKKAEVKCRVITDPFVFDGFINDVNDETFVMSDVCNPEKLERIFLKTSAITNISNPKTFDECQTFLEPDMSDDSDEDTEEDAEEDAEEEFAGEDDK